MKAGNVLIVDDEPGMVELLSVNLRGSGYDVEVAFDGEDALEKLRGAKRKADVVILDVMLPKINGYEVARRLKADDKTSGIPIIMLTAKDQPLDKVMGLIDCEADYYFTKPLNMSDFLIHVMKVSEKHRRASTNNEAAPLDK
ncbi:MAG: two-component system response regulator [Elusimicrobia bacterium HGW-Elusimicrobia-1]|jgi:two-component system response regulator VicR|nr:MAG: two-component system response regulator [Elusimicrobia bacterium HGW-Elusimicrobia-3]PKN01485.1 MAG: two-component system response regulator [Elusimicrobia bacterium HGW-Elusimicrobia-1]